MPNNTLKHQTSLVMWLVNPLNQIKLHQERERYYLRKIASLESENLELKQKRDAIVDSCFRMLENGFLKERNVTISNCQIGAYIEKNEGVINSKRNHEKYKTINTE